MDVTFEKLKLKPEIVRATKDMGFEVATPIQAESLPILFQGADLIGQAQTGSGKTAAFGIAILETIDTHQRAPQALVVVPTRELAVQVSDEINKLGRYLRVSVVSVYGGASMNRQIDDIRRDANVIVGTPGRIIDHLKRGTLRLNQVKIVVLDEADRMLDMGFIHDVELILKHVPAQRQTLLFSATMANEIKALAHKFMHAPEHLKVSEDVIPLDKIKQTYVLTEPHNKVEVLLNCLSGRKRELTLVFTRTKRTADKISRVLHAKGFHSMALHGNLSQNQRDRAMNAFRKAHIHVLVATDLASRGLDVLNISHVINYDLPEEPAIYSHRVGRTARAGASGEAISIITPDQHEEFSMIESYNHVKLERETVEGGITGEWIHRAPEPRTHGGRGRGGHGQRRSQYGQHRHSSRGAQHGQQRHASSGGSQHSQQRHGTSSHGAQHGHRTSQHSHGTSQRRWTR